MLAARSGTSRAGARRQIQDGAGGGGRSARDQSVNIGDSVGAARHLLHPSWSPPEPGAIRTHTRIATCSFHPGMCWPHARLRRPGALTGRRWLPTPTPGGGTPGAQRPALVPSRCGIANRQASPSRSYETHRSQRAADHRVAAGHPGPAARPVAIPAVCGCATGSGGTGCHRFGGVLARGWRSDGQRSPREATVSTGAARPRARLPRWCWRPRAARRPYPWAPRVSGRRGCSPGRA